MRRREILQLLFADIPTKDLEHTMAALLVCDGITWAAAIDRSPTEARDLIFHGACDVLMDRAPKEEEAA
jgi:hypothetical protein